MLFCQIAGFPFSTKVTIQVIPVGVDMSNETPTGTSRLFIGVIIFVSVFAEVQKTPKTPKSCNCDLLLPCLILSFSPSYW